MEHFHGFRFRTVGVRQGREPFHQPFPQRAGFRHPVPPGQNGLDGREGARIKFLQSGKQVIFRFRKELLLDFIQRGAAVLLVAYSQGGAEQGGTRQAEDGPGRALFFQRLPQVAEQVHDAGSGKGFPFRIVEAPAVFPQGGIQGYVHVRVTNAQGDVRRCSLRCAGDHAARFPSQPGRVGRDPDLGVADMDGALGPDFRKGASPGVKGTGFLFRRVYPYLDGHAAAFRMLEGLAQGARNVRYAGQDDVPSCFPQGMEQMRRCFRLHGGSVRKLPAFQLLRAVLRQPVHVRPAFVTARAGILGHAAGNALVRHGVFKALQAARHFQHAGKILRHVPGEQARIKTVGRGSQRLEPAGQFFQDGSRFLLFLQPGELVRRNNLGGEDGLCAGNGGKVFPQLPAGFPCGDQHQIPVEVVSQGKQPLRYSPAGRFVPG